MGLFQKAEKTKVWLRLALAGVSGGGKTYSALVMAKELGGPVALIDSERSSALLYADKFDFDHTDLTSHSIDRYREAIKAAAEAKYRVLIIDSLSHEWAGRGGVLEQVDRAKGAGNGFAAWNGPSQQHNSLVDDLLLFPGHVIVTMRKKADYVLEEQVKNGKKIQVPRKVGMAVVQREGVEFEFTVLLSMERDGSVIVEKSRCAAIEEKAHVLRREDLAEAAITLRDWLAAGKEAQPAMVTNFPKPEAPTSPPTTDPVGIEVEAVIAAAGRLADLPAYEALRARAKALEGVASPAEYKRVSAAMAKRKGELSKGSA